MSLYCSHCRSQLSCAPEVYTAHVKACIIERMANWSEHEYSARYHEQARAISRFPQRGAPKRRSPFRSWAWATVHPGGPSLVKAEANWGNVRNSAALSYAPEEE